jgi:hypothetical protein
MKVSAITVVLVLLAVSAHAILNGELSPHKPYYARISFRLVEGNQAQTLNKAGTIISDRFVLTTGFYFGNSWDFRVWVGSSIRAQQQSYIGVGLLRVSTFPDGPAIIQLTEPLVFSNAVRPIRMISSGVSMALQNEQGMVVGLGGNTPVTQASLHAAFMRIASTESCTLFYPTRESGAYFCAFDAVTRSDFCPEDRGTAFTVMSRGEEFLAGIAIEGVCSAVQHTRPSLFANIAHFRNRINEILDGLQSM